ncbi:MAG: MFS transporter [Chloroflexi bacterium]|nr:MFS transporter [Chloroflexota bacterium]
MRKRIRALLPVYLPAAILSFVQGLMFPAVPLYALSLEGSLVLVSLAVAAERVGTMLGDVPTGVLLERMGRKRCMVIGCLAITVALIVGLIVPSFWVFVATRFVSGIGTAMWSLSRMAHLIHATPPSERGKAMSEFAGMSRIGVFAGPGVAGIVGVGFGLQAPFVLAAAIAAAALVISAAAIPSDDPAGRAAYSHRSAWGVLRVVARTRWRDLLAAASALLCAAMIRNGRQVVVPLYGATVLGLGVGEIGAIMTIAAAVDMCLFVPAGVIMDRFGRKFTSVPAFAIMGVGMALIAVSSDYTGLLIAVCVVGVGNGLGSGSMFTLGADLAPREATGEFLGLWRMIGDAGNTAAPAAVGVVGEVFGMAGAALIFGAIGLLGAFTLGAFVRETLQPRKALA